MSAAGPSREQPWTPKALLDWTEPFFRSKGIHTARLDAELLLAYVLGCRRIDLYLQFDRPLQPPELDRYRELVRARGQRTPVAYLVGEAEFWGLPLYIDASTLIPGQDTETLVEVLLRVAPEVHAAEERAPLGVLELGTGSGAVPLAACSALQHVTWVGTERSAATLALARRNAARHEALLAPRGNRLLLVAADRFEPIRPAWQPHLVVGNPPYIPSGTIARLMPEVSRAEPRLALDGGPDGTDFQRYMLAWAGQALAPGGRVLLEMGAEQAELLQAAVAEVPGLEWVGTHEDTAGHPRVLDARRTGAG